MRENRVSMHPLQLDASTRSELWQRVATIVERYVEEVAGLPVEAVPEASRARAAVAQFDFDVPLDPRVALERVVDAMREMQTHTAHPRYFGLFNPAPTTMGIVGETLVAAFNPQLAGWSHSPFAVQAEHHLVRSMGSRFGEAFTNGNFTSGGAEANLTAMICALMHRFPTFGSGGMRSLPRSPVAYASAAAHHSLVKAARVTGLGTENLRIVPCDASLGMDVRALAAMIDRDRAAGYEPFLVAATAGATTTGVVERLDAIGALARVEGLWMHVDAAWGGFAAFVPELAGALAGIGGADSITFDPHKMLSVPLGAGLFLTRHRDVLAAAFSVTADYMPAHDEDDERADPFTHSLQWSRRFIGLKVLLSLAVAGWAGYAHVLRRQTALGNVLRSELRQAGWRIANETPFPVVCFTHSDPILDLAGVASGVQRAGRAWISPARLPDGTPVLRACVTNYRTTEDDVRALVREVEAARKAAQLGEGA
jgi:glutamate/tyrosine decarboxylase-like PLP-dependent enzyme